MIPNSKATIPPDKHNKYLAEVRSILLANNWIKCNVDSLWYHPKHGRMHILFAYHIVLTTRENLSVWQKLLNFIRGR
jgi:hypothetical protein